MSVVNLSEELALLHKGLAPVFRSTNKPNWQRLRRDQVFYYNSQAHSNRLVLSMAFKFDNVLRQVYQFALVYPFSHTKLMNFLQRWAVELKRQGKSRKDIATLVELKVKVLCNSALKREIVFVSVIGGQIQMQKKPSVKLILLASVDGANLQWPSTLVTIGFLDSLLCGNEIVCKDAQKQLEAHVLPLIDVDANKCGNSKTNIFGRSNGSLFWQTLDVEVETPKMRFLYALDALRQALVAEVQRSSKKNCHEIEENIDDTTKRTIIIELSVNFELIGAKIVGCQHKDSIRMERHASFARQMARFCDSFYLEHCQFTTTRLSCAKANKPLLAW